MEAIYTAAAGVVLAGLGILIRQFFAWVNSRNVFKSGKVKIQLLETLEQMAVKGIAVADQEFVDRLRKSGAWKTSDEELYKSNTAKALEMAKDAVVGLLTKAEWAMVNKLFGKDEAGDVIKSVILEQIKKSKSQEIVLL
ncbi:MAG: hypothetical protein FWD58_07035 [Firmicutes bacterium]|nr:hypothetical protein [Bacillota bacterium]